MNTILTIWALCSLINSSGGGRASTLAIYVYMRRLDHQQSVEGRSTQTAVPPKFKMGGPMMMSSDNGASVIAAGMRRLEEGASALDVRLNFS
eukprot:COSAG02_NODE_109_length_36250_cov_121.168903_17_plen_92_part_00